MARAELEAINQTGLLRGGRPGETFFTTDYYAEVSQAVQKLSLPTPPEIGVEFQILNRPVINGPKIVEPIPGVTTGGGIEYWTSDPVRVIVRKTWELLMK
jgi:hypothetical protein